MIQINSGRARRRGTGGTDILSDQEWAGLAERLRLSVRELQILQGVFDELKDGAIAERLTMSVHTVRTHFERLYRKLEVSSRSGLVIRVFSECMSQFGTRESLRPVAAVSD